MNLMKHVLDSGLALCCVGGAMAGEIHPFNGKNLQGWKLKGPLMFQGDHGAVAYRHINVLPLD